MRTDSVVTSDKNRNKSAHKSGHAFFLFVLSNWLTGDKSHSHVYIIDIVGLCFLRDNSFHLTESTGPYINPFFISGGREVHHRKDMKWLKYPFLLPQSMIKHKIDLIILLTFVLDMKYNIIMMTTITSIYWALILCPELCWSLDRNYFIE